MNVRAEFMKSHGLGVSNMKISSVLREWLYTVSQKKGATLTMAITLSILDRFAKFFHCCKQQEISYKTLLGYPPHLEYVAALPWKT